LFVVGWSFFSFVPPSLAVFEDASAFNQDVSKWNTVAVTNMEDSKCDLSHSPWPRLPLLCILNLRQFECVICQLITLFSHVVLFCFFYM
jgi:surface protein